MWGSHSFNSVGARLRAAVGKVRETVSRNSVEYDDDEIETERPFAIETDYEEHSVPVETGEPAKILVRKQTSVVYFEEDEEAAPVVVSNARDRPVSEEPVNQVEKKPRIAVTIRPRASLPCPVTPSRLAESSASVSGIGLSFSMRMLPLAQISYSVSMSSTRLA